jgi:hypothetical protein
LTGCVLDIGRRRYSTDARDLVYGMLGITNDLGILCDYSLSVTQVRLDLIHKSLQSGDLSLLHYCNDEGSPSYIPVLHPDHYFDYLPVRSIHSPFKAGQRFSVDLNLGKDQTISMRGTLIDVVQDHEPVWKLKDGRIHSNSASYIAEVLQDVLHCLHDYYRHLDNDRSQEPDQYGPSTEHETIFEVIGRAMHPDVITPQTATGEERNTRSWLSAPSNNICHGTRLDLSVLDHLHCSQIKEKSIFRTTHGYVGFGTWRVKPEDLIVIFDGAKTTFLIREEKDCYPTHTKKYRIISDCYLHGWMDGDYFGHTVLEQGQVHPNQTGGMSDQAETQRIRCSEEMERLDAAEQGTEKPFLRKKVFVIC